MEQIVPPKSEVCVDGVCYRAGDVYDDGKKEPKKPTPIKKEIRNVGQLSD